MNNISPGPLIRVGDTAAAEKWLCENLFFVKEMESGQPFIKLKNGSCTLYLEQGNSNELPAPAPGGYYTGLSHIALRTGQIEAAAEWCNSKGLAPQLEDGKPHFNPGVFGGGEWYFNILSPFGVVFEVSQRVSDNSYQGKKVISDLDHLGNPCPHFTNELVFVKNYGFVPEFDPLQNYNNAEGHILCVVASLRGITVEIYQFIDQHPIVTPEDSPLRGIYHMGFQACSPGGLKIFE